MWIGVKGELVLPGELSSVWRMGPPHPGSTGFAANMRLLWRMSGPHRHTAPSHTCTQVHAHVVAYVCMHAKCALTSPTTHVCMCSHKLALCNVTVSRKQTSSSQSPQPTLSSPPPCLLPTLIYRPPDGSPQSVRKPRLPVSPGGFHFLARKVQGWVRCFPFAL